MLSDRIPASTEATHPLPACGRASEQVKTERDGEAFRAKAISRRRGEISTLRVWNPRNVGRKRSASRLPASLR